MTRPEVTMAHGLKERVVVGDLHRADFDDKTLEFRIAGDMPTVSRGRYAILPLSDWQNLARRAALTGENKPR